MTSINSAWAYKISSGVTIYFDNYITNWTYPEMQVYQSESNKPSYRFEKIGTTTFYYYNFSGGWGTDQSGYGKILYYNYTGYAWGNKSADQAYDIPNNAVIVPKADAEGTAVGYFTNYKKAYPSNRVYFDATPIAGWGDKAYLRYGFDCIAHADPMTKFPGTANLFYIDIQEAYYEKYTVSNNYGYTKNYTVYQPTDDCEPTGTAAITKSLNFSDTDINGGDSKILSFIPTSKASTSHSCDWWNYTKNTNTSIPTQTVTISSTTNGKIRVEYTGTDGEATSWEGSGGTTLTVPKSAIITVKALGNSGYDASSITVAGNSFTNGNTYTVNSDISISATFVTAYAYVQGRMHVKSGSPSGSWINTFDGEGDSDKWEESSSVIQFTYDGSSSKYVLHTYVTPSDLSSDFTGDLPPYFYVATSSSNAGYTGLRKYRPSEGLTITTANSKATIEEFGGGNSVRINSDVTTGYAVLYFDQSKVWYLLEHSLDYAAGSGSGDAPSTVYYMNGTEVAAAAANTFSAPTGYHFDHWAGSNSTNYNAGATVTMDANLTLTAQWTANTFTVRFNKNGGSGTMADQDFTYDDTESLNANAFTRDGYYFEGWSESADGSATIEDEADGSTLCTTNGGTKNLYAVWTAATSKAASCWDGDTWDGPASGFDTPKPTSTSLSWNTAKWAKGTGEGKMPTIETQVVIPASTTMTIADGVTATAKEIVLGSGAKLDVEAGGALILGGSVNVGGSATTKNDLILSSDGTNGSAALISSEENTGTAATVEFYTKATYNSAAEVGAQYVNQYFGIPFDEVEADIYDETEYVYEFNVNENKWDPVNIYGTMTAFTAYNILRTSTTAGAMTKSGTLNLPGTTTHKDQVLNLTRLAADVAASKNTTNMFANSWTAPINIASMVTEVDETLTTPEFVGVDPTIYIFNAGTYADKDNVGQWISLPVKSVYDNPGSYALNVIPSQQAFLVYATGAVGATHTLTLDYKKHVYDPAKAAADAGEDIGIAPAKAPKRTTATNNNFMAVNVSGESGFGDRVMIFTDGDFSEGFDSGWDGRKLSGKGYTPQLYALTSDGEMAVNSVPTAEGTVLGFKRGSQDTNYTISFEYNGDEEWYLNDTEEQQSTLINAENTYEFTATSDADAARFVISKTPIKKVPTGISNINEGVNARKLIIDGQLYIIRDGRIYNAEGAVVK